MVGLRNNKKKEMENKYEKYFNSESKIYEFELKKDYDRNGKLLKAGIKIPTTQEGIDWFLENGYGEEKKIKKNKASKKKQEIEL
jgi:hypothetical protein